MDATNKHQAERPDQVTAGPPALQKSGPARWSRMVLVAVVLLVIGGGVAASLLLSFRAPDLSSPNAAASAVVNALNKGDIGTLKRIYGSDLFQREAEECRKSKGTRPPDKTMPGFLVKEWNASQRIDCDRIEENLVQFMARLKKSPGLSVAKVVPSDREAAFAYIAPPNWNFNDKWLDEVGVLRDEHGVWRPWRRIVRYPTVLFQAADWEDYLVKREANTQ